MVLESPYDTGGRGRLSFGKPCTCRSGRLFEDCCRVDAACDEPPILDGVIVQTYDGLVMEARNLSVDA